MAPSPVAACADQPLHQPEQEREEEFEPLAVAAEPAKPLGELVRGGPVKLRQPGEGREDVAVKRDALAGGKFESAAYAALAQLECDGKRLGVDLVLIALERRTHGPLQLVVTQRRDAERPAAGADGDGDAALRRRHQEEQRARRRLFQRLQQRIGGVLVEIVGAIDDDHAPPGFACAMAEEVAQAAHLVDADILRVALRLVVPRPADQKQVRVTETRNFTEHGMIGVDRSVRRPLLAAREHLAGKAIGERRLADPFGSDHKPGVMQPAAVQGLAEFGKRRFMAEQAIDLARR